MSLSGISVSQEVIKQYENKRFKKKQGGLVFKINGEELIVEKEYGADFASMVSDLPLEEPRFVLYDIEMKNRANLDDIRTIFIFWMPMEASVKMRMGYASTKSLITKAFRGIAAQIQEEDKDKLELSYVVNKIQRRQGINNIAI